MITQKRDHTKAVQYVINNNANVFTQNAVQYVLNHIQTICLLYVNYIYFKQQCPNHAQM